MNYKKLSLIIGFLVWLIATLTFRFAGQYFFLTTNTIVLVCLYLLVIPVLGIIANWAFNQNKLGKLESIHSATLMVLPGMLLDTFCIKYFDMLFPNLPKTDAAIFGSWLMWAYASVLFFGLIRKHKND